MGFEFTAEDIQLKFKLSQNRFKADVKGAVTALSGQAAPDSPLVAQLMQSALERKSSQES